MTETGVVDPNSTVDPNSAEAIAMSLVPMFMDGTKKAVYLGYIIAHFSITEALELANTSMRTLLRWRMDDIDFDSIEKLCKTDLRKKLSKELSDIEFSRNFKLFMAKDFSVLFKDAKDEELTDDEKKYLVSIRKYYTPQNLAIIKQLTGDKDANPAGFNFSQLTMTLKRTQESITISAE